MDEKYLTLQRNNINIYEKLLYKDILRITKNFNTSIFNNNECVLYKNYILNSVNKKCVYFRLNNKKFVLQRLLYYNYINDIKVNEYIKYNCNNKNNYGICCNINHIYKK